MALTAYAVMVAALVVKMCTSNTAAVLGTVPVMVSAMACGVVLSLFGDTATMLLAVALYTRTMKLPMVAVVKAVTTSDCSVPVTLVPGNQNELTVVHVAMSKGLSTCSGMSIKPPAA